MSLLYRPVWYSWSEARKPGNESHEPQQGDSRTQQPRNGFVAGYHSTLLDLSGTASNVALYRQYPTSKAVCLLWDTFLTNVHPVVKVFFDWDKEPVLQKAASDPASLSQGQQALCFAVYFIAALSLSDEECKAKLDSLSRQALLKDFQSSVETALVAANYASTSDLLVLQAFILYMVSNVPTVFPPPPSDNFTSWQCGTGPNPRRPFP